MVREIYKDGFTIDRNVKTCAVRMPRTSVCLFLYILHRFDKKCRLCFGLVKTMTMSKSYKQSRQFCQIHVKYTRYAS